MTPLEGLGGVYPVSGRNGAWMARFDADFAARHRLAARLNYAHERVSALEAQNNDQIAGLLAPERTAALVTLDPTAVFTLSSVLRPHRLNDFRFSAAQRKFDMTPNSFAPPVNIPGAAFLGRENILPHYRKEKHFHLDDVVTLLVRTHILKFGGDWMRGPADIEYHRLLNGLFVFGSQPAPGAPAGSPPLTPVQAYGLGLAANYTQIFGDPRAHAGKTSFGLFFQDSWRAHPRLTIDAGLRYDVEKAAAPSSDPRPLEAVFTALSLRRSPPTDWNNVQPRIGFAWQPPGTNRLTVRGSYGLYYDRLLNLATYLAAVNDGVQASRVILTGAAAAAVFQAPAQKLASYPAGAPPTGLIAFSRGWQLGYSQQGNFMLSQELRRGLALEAGYVWVRGVHLGRSRDMNPPDTARAAAFVAAGNPLAALLRQNYFRPVSEVSEAMAFEGSASSVFHGLRLGLRGEPAPGLVLNAGYTLSKAIDDAEEIFPHSRAQDMRNFRAERGLALYDQRHRAVVSFLWTTPKRRGLPRWLRQWTLASIFEAGSGRPVNVLLGSDNNLDQDPSADRPDVVPRGTPGSFLTALGVFAAPPLGRPGNLGRNAFTGPGYASLSLRLQRELRLGERVSLQAMAEAFNALNRVNIRAVNPNYQRAGEPLAAFDPRQVQLGLRVRF